MELDGAAGGGENLSGADDDDDEHPLFASGLPKNFLSNATLLALASLNEERFTAHVAHHEPQAPVREGREICAELVNDVVTVISNSGKIDKVAGSRKQRRAAASPYGGSHQGAVAAAAAAAASPSRIATEGLRKTRNHSSVGEVDLFVRMWNIK
jgi:hypothetical protein